MTKNTDRKNSTLKKTLFILLIALGTVLIAATCISFYISRNVTLGTMLPGAAGLVIAAWAILRLKLARPVIPSKPWRIVVTVVVCIGILSFVVVEAIIIAYACADTADKDADCVIVLGCGVFPDGRLTLTLQNRLDAAYDYLITHEDVLCVVSGGQAPDEPVPEADAMKEYLIGRGIDEQRILAEPESVDTKQNIANSMALIRQCVPDVKTAAIVTSDFHVFRAVLIARNSDVDAFGLAAPTPWYIAVNCYMREYVGVFYTLLCQRG